ncbi:MAG: bifunctional aconitate hydratase 2/2-methylisocitrate dehydratase [Desulfobacteraceae bacterium]|jgi:aconitate hydratase 2/2-methylisocitrate dehydratase|nr:bifunctional aconitate hydratase 2/2-methylisocitrate dehydratase [Desulfobacteraceae bacterium]
MITEYLKHKQEREAQGIPPKPLTDEQVRELTGLLQNPAGVDESLLLDLITNRVPAGVDEAAEVKANFLYDTARNRCQSPLISPQKAVFLLSTMGGGYNIAPLIDLLDHTDLAQDAANALSQSILIFDAFDEIFEKSNTNAFARQVVDAWADARWFTEKPSLPEKLTFTVFKVEGEINTDDFSPASEAWSRPDIPLHALCMLSSRLQDNTPNMIDTINQLKQKGLPIAFIGDVVGTGSSRKSASNSVIWHIGEDIPYIPNKRRGGVVIGSTIAPIFFNSLEDAGALPIECDVSRIKHGDTITILTRENRIINTDTGEELAQFQLKTNVIVDEVQAGGRIPLIIGRTLTEKARKALGVSASDAFENPPVCKMPAKGYTQAQKMVGRACECTGILPGEYCEPKITTVGSQDTTGPMTRDEIKELACLQFSADLVMQSFCHTAAYPKAVDITMQNSLHEFIKNRGGIALLPGDGIIHAWLNRMLLPDTVGTGGDSHTRFPIGISFPAGSGLIAFAAALGFMPLDMPESVLVKFTGELQPGITIRDVVNAVPYTAIQKGLLTVKKEGKKNIFAGRIIEFEGWPALSVAQAYELTNASAERSAAAATIDLSVEAVTDFLKDNIKVLKTLLADGYGDADTIARRIDAIEQWLKNPELVKRDVDAVYAAEVEVNLSDIREPILACPNDPDDVRLLSDIAGTPIDEVFIGSCMTGISHFHEVAQILENKKNLPVRLWMTPPTRIDAQKLKTDGLFSVFGAAGARIETPGCSLCMGNQGRVADETTVISTSTRNFPNRMGDDTQVYLGSAQLSSICAILGRIPTVEEYMGYKV